MGPGIAHLASRTPVGRQPPRGLRVFNRSLKLALDQPWTLEDSLPLYPGEGMLMASGTKP